LFHLNGDQLHLCGVSGRLEDTAATLVSDTLDAILPHTIDAGFQGRLIRRKQSVTASNTNDTCPSDWIKRVLSLSAESEDPSLEFAADTYDPRATHPSSSHPGLALTENTGLDRVNLIINVSGISHNTGKILKGTD
jgi:hypothetical protein